MLRPRCCHSLSRFMRIDVSASRAFRKRIARSSVGAAAAMICSAIMRSPAEPSGTLSNTSSRQHTPLDAGGATSTASRRYRWLPPAWWPLSPTASVFISWRSGPSIVADSTRSPRCPGSPLASFCFDSPVQVASSSQSRTSASSKSAMMASFGSPSLCAPSTAPCATPAANARSSRADVSSRMNSACEASACASSEKNFCTSSWPVATWHDYECQAS